MRRALPPLDTCVFAALAGIMLAATVLFTAQDANAAEEKRESRPSCSCPDAQQKSARPKFADYPARLDESDEIAALASLQIGLTEMGDGSPYVWRHGSGRLSGIVRPTRSFRSASGALCRHVVVLLTTGFRTSTVEGVACRQEGGRWRL